MNEIWTPTSNFRYVKRRVNGRWLFEDQFECEIKFMLQQWWAHENRIITSPPQPEGEWRDVEIVEEE